MLCCTFVAFLLALLSRPVMALRGNPLNWRPAQAATAQATIGPILRARNRASAFRHAGEGIVFVFRNEPNIWIDLTAAALVVVAGLWIGLDLAEWRWLIAMIAIVLTLEAFNTAIEQACNAVTREFHPAIKAAKDIAAGAVLLFAIFAVIIGASIFVPHLAGGSFPLPGVICESLSSS